MISRCTIKILQINGLQESNENKGWRSLVLFDLSSIPFFVSRIKPALPLTFTLWDVNIQSNYSRKLDLLEMDSTPNAFMPCNPTILSKRLNPSYHNSIFTGWVSSLPSLLENNCEINSSPLTEDTNSRDISVETSRFVISTVSGS